MQRREFLTGTGLLALSLMTLKANQTFATEKLFCDGDLNVPLEGAIDSNHGHRLLIPRQDVLDGVDKSYDIHAAATHGHLVIVTKENFAELRKSGKAVLKSEPTGGHGHSITLICAD